MNVAKDEAPPAGPADSPGPADASHGRDPRPDCPSCGSPRTQPFDFGGPVARFNMKCTVCGHLFKVQRSKY